MKIHPHGEGAIIIGDGENNSLEAFSAIAKSYLEETKDALPQTQKDILACEARLFQEIPIPEIYKLEGVYSDGWGFYTIKDSKVQDYAPVLDTLLDTFYSHVEKKLTLGLTPAQTAPIIDTLQVRKALVKISILQTIQNFQMDKLVSVYNNGKVKYDCAPQVIATISRGEKTYISYIFNPIADMNVIARVGGSMGGGQSVSHICISKDVFASPDEKNKENTYLYALLGYTTKDELMEAMQSGSIHKNEQANSLKFLAQNIQRIIEDTN